jgi:hypothetical protein
MNYSIQIIEPFMKTAFQKLLLLAASGLLIGGCASKPEADDAPQANVAAPGAAGTDLYLVAPTQPPPKDRKDSVPPPPGLAARWWFIPGRWDWRGQWVWVEGHWRPRPHPGDYWIGGQWEKKGDIYVWKQGHWFSGSHDGE